MFHFRQHIIQKMRSTHPADNHIPMTDQSSNILLYFKCVSVHKVDTKIFLRNEDT